MHTNYVWTVLKVLNFILVKFIGTRANILRVKTLDKISKKFLLKGIILYKYLSYFQALETPPFIRLFFQVENVLRMFSPSNISLYMPREL